VKVYRFKENYHVNRWRFFCFGGVLLALPCIYLGMMWLWGVLYAYLIFETFSRSLLHRIRGCRNEKELLKRSNKALKGYIYQSIESTCLNLTPMMLYFMFVPKYMVNIYGLDAKIYERLSLFQFEANVLSLDQCVAISLLYMFLCFSALSFLWFWKHDIFVRFFIPKPYSISNDKIVYSPVERSFYTSMVSYSLLAIATFCLIAYISENNAYYRDMKIWGHICMAHSVFCDVVRLLIKSN
jgi:hypothetical protein